jgi:hypothetical protein
VRLGDERGVALTVAIFSLALMITLGGVALNQAVQALHHTSVDGHQKRALQAADAAIDAATSAASFGDIGSTLNINPLDPSTVVTQNCVVSVGAVGGVELTEADLDVVPLNPLTQADAAGRKWCPNSGGENPAPGDSFDYRLSQLVRAGAGPCGNSGALTLDREVVGVGRSGSEVRRVKAHLEANIALLSGAAVQASGTAGLTMSGVAKILGDAQSNGPITGAGTNVISGNATPGKGYGPVSGVIPGGSSQEACDKFVIPQVDQGTAPTINDNNPFPAEECLNVLTLLQQASCVLPIVGRTGKVTYDSAKRTLVIEGNARARLTKSVYSFCSIVLKGNGILQVTNSSPMTRIFLDDPANCPGVAGAGTISMTEQARIVNCHLQTAPETLQIYAVGSSTTATTQTLAGTGLLTSVLRGTVCGLSLGAILGEPMTIIAPNSRVDIGGSTAISGQVAAKQVTMAGTSSVNPISALVNLNRLGSRPVLPLYKAVDYIECTGHDFTELPAAQPAQGC